VGWLVGWREWWSEEEEASVACLEKRARAAWAYIGLLPRPLPLLGRGREMGEHLRERVSQQIDSSLDLGLDLGLVYLQKNFGKCKQYHFCLYLINIVQLYIS
jgi:hypothetical protein